MPEQIMSYQEKLEKEIYDVRNYTSTDDNAEALAKDNIAAQAEAIREFWDYVNPNPNTQLTAEMYLEEHGYIDKTDVIAAEYAKQAESRCIPKNDKSTLQIIKDATERTDNT